MHTRKDLRRGDPQLFGTDPCVVVHRHSDNDFTSPHSYTAPGQGESEADHTEGREDPKTDPDVVLKQRVTGGVDLAIVHRNGEHRGGNGPADHLVQ